MRLVDPPQWPQVVAVIGGGRMGSGIAEAFAAGALDVRITDADPELSARARERVVQRARSHVNENLIDAALIDRAERTQACESIAEACSGADLVLEAVAEDIDVKHAVLAEVERAAGADAVIATNTSSLPVDRLAEPLARPERFIGMHWFNPPEWTPGVEVVLGPHTDRANVDRVVELLRMIGKQPSVVAGGVGFIANRLQMAMFCEASRCVEEGLASPRDIDEVVRSCFGFRLPYFGPFQIADMAGLDVYEAVIEQHQRGLGARFEVPEMLRALVRAGRTGTASGSGFYDYEAGASELLLVERDRRYAALNALLQARPPLEFDGGERP
jgi:3-hydroxybutyryl-CoA dehydrogenase